jgi:hypothetical protein
VRLSFSRGSKVLRAPAPTGLAAFQAPAAEKISGMDSVSIATGLIAAQASFKADTLAAKFLQQNAASDRAVADLVQAASTQADKLANLAAGIGGNLDVTV